MTRWRRAEVLINNEWVAKEIDDLKVGDIFRLFEDDNTPVCDGKPQRVTSNPVPTEDGVVGNMMWNAGPIE
jgi:hypothetical protein